jgi:hypothetical protein
MITRRLPAAAFGEGGPTQSLSSYGWQATLRRRLTLHLDFPAASAKRRTRSFPTKSSARPTHVPECSMIVFKKAS